MICAKRIFLSLVFIAGFLGFLSLFFLPMADSTFTNNSNDRNNSIVQVRLDEKPSLFSSNSDFLTFSADTILTYSEWKLWSTEQKKELLQDNLHRFTLLRRALPQNPLIPGNPARLQQESQEMASIQEKLLRGEASKEQLVYYYKTKIRRNVAMEDVMKYMLSQNPNPSIERILKVRLESIRNHLQVYRKAKANLKEPTQKL